MIIEFDPAIFESEANHNQFCLLLHLSAIDHRYDIFVDLSVIRESALYISLSKNDKETLEDYYNHFITQSAAPDYFVSIEPDDDILSLVEGIMYFNQPLSIILENSLNDKPFLESLVKNFKKRSKKISRYLEHRWINIVNGGGRGNIKHVINEQLATFENRPKPPKFYLRCFVLVDSDSKYPGHESNELAELKTLLAGLDIDFHILVKREMENYMPDEGFALIDNNDDIIAAYLRLNPIQRDYFDLENGFVHPLEHYDQQIQDLFGDVSEADMKIFRKGGIKMDNFKLDFPKLFLKNEVNRDNLQQRVVHQGTTPDELETVLDKIKKLL
ncbi:hypothetical protein SAMN05428975_0242 [Mucilaginibacter sp. OK268]|nr:hypothetical protein SAMN05428975_0242 [Mucilaginibacter sp. OK268]